MCLLCKSTTNTKQFFQKYEIFLGCLNTRLERVPFVHIDYLPSSPSIQYKTKSYPDNHGQVSTFKISAPNAKGTKVFFQVGVCPAGDLCMRDVLAGAHIKSITNNIDFWFKVSKLYPDYNLEIMIVNAKQVCEKKNHGKVRLTIVFTLLFNLQVNL